MLRRLVVFLASLLLAIATLGTATQAEAAPSRAPSVSKLSTAFGSTSGGASLTITGSGFKSVRTVKFGTVAASNVRVVSSSQIVVTTPAYAYGVVDVTVVTSSGTSRVGGFSQFAFHHPGTTGTVTISRSPNTLLICPTSLSRCGLVTVTTQGFSSGVNCRITKSDYGPYGSFWSQGVNETAITEYVFDGTFIEVTCDGVVGKNYSWPG